MPTPEVSVGVPAAPGLGEDTGPHPVVRAVMGLLLGLGVGLASALLLPVQEGSASISHAAANPPPTSPIP